MLPLSRHSTDAELIAHVDRWAALLEAEQYDAAFAFTDHEAEMRWTPQLIRDVIKGYDEAKESQRVTVDGKPTDVRQRKTVTRWPTPRRGRIGQIWYDLNIDGVVSDLTATFWIVESPNGLMLMLNDLHVM